MEPDWVTPGDTSVPTTQEAGPSSSVPMGGGGGSSMRSGGNVSAGEGRGVLAMISLWCMGLSAAMGTLGVITMIDNKPTSVDDLTECFLGAYMVIFAAILFLYELCWWQPFPAINRTFRKNFGFMYGLRSKGFYLVFIAFLTIGLYDASELSIKGLDWAAGIGWLATGFFLITVPCFWPELLDTYKPPTAGLTSGPNDENVV